MTQVFQLEPIGKVRSDKGRFWLEVDAPFRKGLTGLENYQYLVLLWWGHMSDTSDKRTAEILQKPYTKGPDEIGTFATRSETRPNPILLTICQSYKWDLGQGTIDLGWVDAADGSPLLDIKPYLPASDRVATCQMPNWCSHWPASLEKSGDFNWEVEFNF